ncbi:hypothetical protein ACFY5A_17770 [Microbacterium sp. NPDC012755]|uniref:hypothetical protein n=1 Tax=Microbacterium sp. NPDC012755 TaxID=3364184 RepID=UPI0036BB9D8B
MILQRTAAHSLSGLGALALIAGAVAGCAPTPTPTPTPTAAFASEEEAFAKAEEVYRAFNARLNEVDLSDTRTFEPLFELSSGSFEAADREAYSTMHADGFIMSGETRVLSFDGVRSKPPFTTVVANVCLDVSSVSIVDSSGVSQVSSDRPSTYALEITFVSEKNHSLSIDSAAEREDVACVVE